jgi:hypothetical protein
VWWYTAVIPACGRLRQDDHKFKVHVGYIASFSLAWAAQARPCLKKKKKKKTRMVNFILCKFHLKLKK